MEGNVLWYRIECEFFEVHVSMCEIACSSHGIGTVLVPTCNALYVMLAVTCAVIWRLMAVAVS
jgi:hypothetical protein